MFSVCEMQCRLSQLRKLELLPNGRTSSAMTVMSDAEQPTAAPATSPRVYPSLNVDHSEAISSASGPAPPWPTPAQLKQSLAAFGRAQAEENARILASRYLLTMPL